MFVSAQELCQKDFEGPPDGHQSRKLVIDCPQTTNSLYLEALIKRSRSCGTWFYNYYYDHIYRVNCEYRSYDKAFIIIILF